MPASLATDLRGRPVDGRPPSRDPAGILVVSLALAGAALLLYQWAGQLPLWLDEEMLAINLRARALGELRGRLWLAQAAPFGWLALQRLVLVAAGTGEAALRLVPLLFGLGTLVAAVWIGRRWLGGTGAAVLALLCAFGPWLAYHAVELKPYSADAFWGLLLPALAAWALEDEGRGDIRRGPERATAWWAVAAVAHWFGTGALLVTPACATVLHATLWKRHGLRASALAALPSLAWALSLGLHYAVALQYAVGHDYLQAYWKFALPPAGVGLTETLAWLGSRLHPLAVKPIGTRHSVLLWALVTFGLVVAIRKRPPAGLLLAALPLSAFAWAGIRAVPMFERLSLWVVPAVYVSVGVAAGALASIAWRGIARRQLMALAAAAAGLVAAVVVCADVTRQGWVSLTQPPGDSNHNLDDRGGVRWLLERAEPGDAVLTTHLALPAVWWYGNIPLPALEEAREGTWRGGGGARRLPVFEAQPSGGWPCESLPASLGRPPRVLVYFGFRFDDWPGGYDDVLFARLAEAGEVVAYRTFSEAGAAMIVDFRRPPAPGSALPNRPGREPAAVVPAGCVAAAPARAW